MLTNIRWPSNDGLMLAHCLWRWPYSKPALVQLHMFSGMSGLILRFFINSEPWLSDPSEIKHLIWQIWSFKENRHFHPSDMDMDHKVRHKDISCRNPPGHCLRQPPRVPGTCITQRWGSGEWPSYHSNLFQNNKYWSWNIKKYIFCI